MKQECFSRGQRVEIDGDDWTSTGKEFQHRRNQGYIGIMLIQFAMKQLKQKHRTSSLKILWKQLSKKTGL